MNAEQKLRARGIRKKLAASVPQVILERISDAELVQKYELKRVEDLKRFNDQKFRSDRRLRRLKGIEENNRNQ